MRICRSFCLLSMVTVTVFACGRLIHAEVTIVTPNELDGVEGNTKTANFGSAFRGQLLVSAADFANLPKSYRTIMGMAVRPDESNTFTDPVTGRARFVLSTTTRDSLDPTFANNLGADATEVFNDVLTWQTDDIGPGPGPRDFDFVVPFTTPFVYDPSQGNLVFDATFPNGFNHVGNWPVDEHRRNTGNITAILGGAHSPNAFMSVDLVWPTQFTVVPEPSTIALLLTTLLPIGIYWRRRKRTYPRLP